MGVNKVEYGSSTLVDLTGDTVTPETLLQGETAHNAAGNRITGTARPGVQTFNGRSGSVLPIAGDYSAEQVNYDSNKTVKQVIDALATKETSDITGQQSLLKDTVGWTGKNLLNITTVGGSSNGITWVVNSDKSISVYGTATGRVDIALLTLSRIKSDFLPLVGETLIVNGCPQGGAIPNGYWISVQGLETDGIGANDGGNGATFTVHDFSNYATVGMRISVASGVNMGTQSDSKVFYPMIRRADIIDDTYEPYHESVEVMYEEEIHGVNLLENTAVSKTENGITFTVNADGSVTVNGTATADTNLIVYNGQKRTDAPFKNIPVILSKGSGALVANTSLYCNVYQGTTYVRQIANCQGILNTESDVFEVDYDGYDGIRVGIVIPNGVTLSNAVFRPMIRKADIEDSTYRPYNNQAIQNQLNAQGVLGAKNLLPIKVTSRTMNGVTFTVNADGSITVNGTATANTSFRLIPYADIVDTYLSLWTGKPLRLSGCPSGGSGNTYALEMFYNDGQGHWLRDFGDGVEVSIPTSGLTDVNPNIMVKNGVTVNNLVFKPMLRLASDPDDTYQPHAMTNRELTENKIDKGAISLTSGNNLNDVTDVGLYVWRSSIPVNAPENKAWYSMFVTRNNTDVTQIAYKIETIYQRSRTGPASGYTWSPWYKFTGTVVS